MKLPAQPIDPVLDDCLWTDRLMLKPMGAGDVEAHIDMMQTPEMAKFLTDAGTPRGRSDEWRVTATLIGHWQIRGYGFFSVFEKQSGEWIGRVGPWQPSGWPGLEVGWAIRKEFWGKGYAPEAAIATMGWVFARFPDLKRILSVIDPANKNSQQVAAKIGETNSGEKFELWGLTLDLWSIDREVWAEKYG